MPAPVWRQEWRTHPLRRPVDVVEAWALLAVGAALWVGAPATGLAAGWSVQNHDRAVAVEQAATRDRVDAVALQNAADVAPSPYDGGRGMKALVTVRWTAPDGQQGQGKALVPADLKRGEHTRIWLDDQHKVTTAPLNDTDIWLGAATIGASATALAAGAAALTGVGVRRLADRRRAAQWAYEWRHTGPDWTRGHA
ncbi:hypothetical protein ABZO31_32395 [Streptomyces sp. HUAS MG47]|uniref:Rv1733c family protein n=1 Tax=Streptomyces solicamelliae TaxID=3231716 RepID=UPI003877FCC6